MEGPVLLEADKSNNVCLPDVLISEAKREKTKTLERGEELGTVVSVDVISGASLKCGDLTPVHMIETDERERESNVMREELKNTLELEQLLEEFHDVLSLSKNDRGETDSVELHIDTGDAVPKRY